MKLGHKQAIDTGATGKQGQADQRAHGASARPALHHALLRHVSTRRARPLPGLSR